MNLTADRKGEYGDGMSQPDSSMPPKRRRFSFRRALVLFAVFWVLYTLSIGPMYWTWYSAAYIRGPSWVLAVYGPLQYTGERVPAFGRWIDDYIWWWNCPAPQPNAEPAQHLAAG